MAPARAGLTAHARRHSRFHTAPFCVCAASALWLLVAQSRAYPSSGTFFGTFGKPTAAPEDAFGKPTAAPEDERQDDSEVVPKVVTQSKQKKKMLLLLRKSQEVDDRWATYCAQAGCANKSLGALAPEFVQEFLVDPANHEAVFLKEFLAHAKLDPVSVPRNIDDDEEEQLIKGEEWLKEERRLLARVVRQFCGRGPEEASSWQRFCDRMQDWEDPDYDDVRSAMFMGTTMGRRKTALESWTDAQSGNAPPTGNEWGS